MNPPETKLPWIDNLFPQTISALRIKLYIIQTKFMYICYLAITGINKNNFRHIQILWVQFIAYGCKSCKSISKKYHSTAMYMVCISSSLTLSSVVLLSSMQDFTDFLNNTNLFISQWKLYTFLLHIPTNLINRKGSRKDIEYSWLLYSMMFVECVLDMSLLVNVCHTWPHHIDGLDRSKHITIAILRVRCVLMQYTYTIAERYHHSEVGVTNLTYSYANELSTLTTAHNISTQYSIYSTTPTTPWWLEICFLTNPLIINIWKGSPH